VRNHVVVDPCGLITRAKDEQRQRGSRLPGRALFTVDGVLRIGQLPVSARFVYKPRRVVINPEFFQLARNSRRTCSSSYQPSGYEPDTVMPSASLPSGVSSTCMLGAVRANPDKERLVSPCGRSMKISPRGKLLSSPSPSASGSEPGVLDAGVGYRSGSRARTILLLKLRSFG